MIDDHLMDRPQPEQPNGQRPELVPLLGDVQSNFSHVALQELSPVLTGIRGVTQNGGRLEITRDAPTSVPLNGDYLNGNVLVRSLNFGGTIGFDYDRQNRTISNIEGVSLNITFLGDIHKTVAIKTARLAQDEAGKRVLHAEFENPLPGPAQRILGMPPVVNVKIPADSGGTLGQPALSQVFADVAATTGPSIAGLLASDTLREVSKVALFAESNPQWIQDVVDPAVRQIYRTIARDGFDFTPDPPAPMAVQVPGTPSPADAAKPHKPADANPYAPMDQTGTPVDVNKPGDYAFTTTIDGIERQYRVHVPPSYDGKTPMPLVLLLHGHSQDGAQIARGTKLNQVADREGFIAIYPDARPWAGREAWRAWDTDNGLVPPGSKASDVAFMRHIIESAQTNYAVDPKRIFMGGLSNGAMMTFRAASELSDKLAAVAIVSGAMSGGEPAIKAPISMLNIHGTDDEIIPYNGLKNVPASLNAIGLPKFKPTPYATDFWAEQNRITSAPIVEEGNGIKQRRFVGANGVEVKEITIYGGRHIPSDIDSTVATIWDFFKNHPKASGTVSGTEQPKPEQPFNIVERVNEHIRARGVHGLELDTGDMVNEVPNLGDGSFSPAGTLQSVEDRTGIKLDDQASTFLKSVNKVSKSGQYISFDLSAPQQIKLGNNDGPVKLSSINVDDASFNLTQINGRPWLKNVQGITFTMNAVGSDYTVALREIGQKLDSSGTPYYHLRTDNPLPAWARYMMFSRSQIPVELQLDNSAHARVLNQRQIKDATLGVNPVTRGYIDIGTHTYRMFDSPSCVGGLHLAKDLAITGGTAFGAYRLAPLRFATKGRVGIAAAATVILAPAIIHGIERLID